jgi:hypothetical protein
MLSAAGAEDELERTAGLVAQAEAASVRIANTARIIILRGVNWNADNFRERWSLAKGIAV